MKKLAIIIAILSLISITCYGQAWEKETKVVGSDRNSGNLFGSSVDIHNNIAIVGAPWNSLDDLGENEVFRAGAAFIYKIDESGDWVQIQKIVAKERTESMNFGESVSIQGATIVVSGRTMDSPFIAFVFEEDNSGNWNFSQKLVPTNTSGQSNGAVSIYEDYIIIGAFSMDNNESGNPLSFAGAAYIFEKDGTGIWQEKQKLVPNERIAQEFFGFSVDIYKDYALVGAYNNKVNGTNLTNGAAYIFKRNDLGIWEQSQQLLASDISSSYFFGYSVSIYENEAVIGANFSDRAYVFSRENDENWLEIATLSASDKVPNESSILFGNSVDISDDLIIVGAPHKRIGNTLNGASYIFHKDESQNWNEVKKLNSSDGNRGDFFGKAVAISQSASIVGAYTHANDVNGGNSKIDAGAAYIFSQKEEETITDFKDFDYSESIMIYPNPMNEYLRVDLKEKYLEDIEISIVSITGSVLFKNSMSNQNSKLQISLTDLPKGLYSIFINTGNEVIIKKVIKN